MGPLFTVGVGLLQVAAGLRGDCMQCLRRGVVNKFIARKLDQAVMLMACTQELLCSNLDSVTVCPD
jgi:hypothetical protein